MAPGRTLGRVLFYLDIGRTIVSFCFALIPAKVSSIVHRFTYRQVSNPKHVVVVGGSYAGAHLAMLLAESLPTGYDVVLVERNSHFNHTFAFPRFSVIGGQENKAFIPYDGIQKAAPAGMLSIIHDSVTSMDEEGHILLSSGRTIHYEYMAIATGAWQPAPARLRARSKDTACSELRRYQKGVAGAGRIAVLGGGAVGVEIAADIKSYFPEKAVTLIHSRAQVLNRFGPRLHEAVLEELERLGVRVVLGQRPSMSETATGFMDSCVELETQPGMAETFDLVVACTGQVPNSGLVAASRPDCVSDKGYIYTLPTLQIANEKSSNTFALGDVADTGGAKMARAGLVQAQIVQHNILSLLRGNPDGLKHYVPEAMEGALSLTIGKDRTLMWLEAGDQDLLIRTKGMPQDMGVKRIWDRFSADWNSLEQADSFFV